MDYIKDAFNRMDLRQIYHFFIYGTDDFDREKQSYRDRLKNGCDHINARLSSIYPDQAERDKAEADLSQALIAHESVYMELGMKAGARLVHQLLITDDLPITDTDDKGADANG